MQRIMVTGGSGFIGTNLVDALRRRGDNVLNADVAEPSDAAHMDSWHPVDLQDRARLMELTREFAPHIVVHAAARTDLLGTSAEDYRANVEGTANLMACAQATPSVRRVVAVSSMLVCSLGHVPATDNHYCPDTAYGASKADAERHIRALPNGSATWVIARPTSIWGPWFGAPYRDFFIAVARRRFRKPRGWATRRSFGYVGNTVHQMLRLADAPAEKVHARTFYLCDYAPILMREWSAQVAHALGVPDAAEIPLTLLRIAAQAGDAARLLGMREPPLTTPRLRNMLTDAVYDTGALRNVCGPLPYTVADGLLQTVHWMNRRKLL